MTRRVSIDILRRERRTRGFTQAEFAQLIGTKSRSQLSRIERGERVPTLDQVIRSRVLFNIPLAELVPSMWSKTLNGLWEDIHALKTRCQRRGDAAPLQCEFLAEAEQQVERLESGDAMRA